MVRYVITYTPQRRITQAEADADAEAAMEASRQKQLHTAEGLRKINHQPQQLQHPNRQLQPALSRIMTPPAPTTPIDLFRGHPSTRLLATTPFLAATTKLLSAPDSLPQDSYDSIRHPLEYGPDYGNLDVRREIVNWQEEFYGSEELDTPPSPGRATSENDAGRVRMKDGKPDDAGDVKREARINLTCGASYGLLNALVQCTSPGTGYTRRAFIVAPTYFLACQIFIDAGFSTILTPIPYPPPPNQTLPDLLISALRLDASSPPQPPASLPQGLTPITGSGLIKKYIYKYVLYCVPTYSNPTGLTWDFETRKRIVEIAREWDILVICDDVYDFLSWDEGVGGVGGVGVMQRLVTLDKQLVKAHGNREGDPGNVLSNCSFSKLLGPGLRCGWQEAATEVLPRQLARSGANKSGGCPSHFVSAVVGELLRPFDETEDRVEKNEGKGGECKKGGKKRKINEIIHGVKIVLGQRARMFIDACYKYLPPGSEVFGHPPLTGGKAASASGRTITNAGGYFLWVSLGPPPTPPHPPLYLASEIIKLAAEGEKADGGEYVNKVTVAGGALFECPGEGNGMGFGERCVRLAVSWCEGEGGVEGIRRLGEACRRWRERVDARTQ